MKLLDASQQTRQVSVMTKGGVADVIDLIPVEGPGGHKRHQGR